MKKSKDAINKKAKLEREKLLKDDKEKNSFIIYYVLGIIVIIASIIVVFNSLSEQSYSNDIIIEDPIKTVEDNISESVIIESNIPIEEDIPIKYDSIIHEIIASDSLDNKYMEIEGGYKKSMILGVSGEITDRFNNSIPFVNTYFPRGYNSDKSYIYKGAVFYNNSDNFKYIWITKGVLETK